MATKPAIPVNKKPAVATKQVSAPARKSGTVSTTTPKKPAQPVKAAGPAKASVKVAPKPAAKKAAPTSPAKVTGNLVKLSDGVVKLNAKESKAFHATKSMDKKSTIVATAAIKSTRIPAAAKKAIVKAVVADTKKKADAAVAARVTTPIKKAESAKTNAKKIGRHIGKAVARAAAVVEKADGPKADAPLKKIVKKIDKIVRKPSKIDVAVKKTGSDTKGYEISTPEKQAAFAAKREASKKPVAALLAPKPASIVEPSKAPVNQYAPASPVQTNKFLPPAPAVAAPAVQALRIPAEISGEEAIKREQLLRQTFKTLTKTSFVGT